MRDDGARFPVDAILPGLLRALADGTRLVLEAPPGAGKTTRVPPALLDADWLGGRKVLLLEPRRIAARAAAEFMAAQGGSRVGGLVGYRIRFENRVSAATRIEVVTEGILTRLIQDDPELGGVGAILFDEFHERHLHGDLGAALALDVQANLRPDLRLVIMSATLDGERVARWFDAPRLASEGRSHPVRVVHPPARSGEAWPDRGWPFGVRRAIETALTDGEGDVLVFLPGKREIERVHAALAGIGDAVDVVALHGDLALAEQHAALSAAAPGRRRVVLATNVAESSLTLPGVRAVVDLGLAREPRFDPNSGFTRLDTSVVSQASADQRAGRAGRLGPGHAYRLWPQSRRLEAERRPEITQVELSQLALELAAWGSDALRWLDPPPAGALAQARELLRRLGALDADGRLAQVGRRMLALGATPRLAAAVLRADAAQAALACDVVALVEARNPLRGDAGRNDDFRVRVAALQAWRAREQARVRDAGADPKALAAIAQAADAWRRRCGDPRAGSGSGRDAVASATAIGDVLVHAFPDRIARQDPGNPRRYTLANGRGARLADDSALYGEPWLVVVDLRQEDRDSLVHAAAPFDPALLERDFADRLVRERSVTWNRDTRAVDAFELRRFDAIVLERRGVPARPEDAVPALLGAVRELGLAALPWSDHARELRLRVNALRSWCPELGLPDFSDAALLASLDEWLAPYLAGKRRLDALQAAELSEALASRIDFAQRRALDEQAPVALRVPSGMERRISYADGAAPVLAVKLQELFGLADTPRIGGGRVPLTLHLLSPGGKPVQVTQDLRSFWERTYPEVKKELKGRYPKHPWPDDPWTAAPTHRAKPRGT
ncbi:ATP-dependent helicase HrpB [Dokdonella fugitiva]|jgi:ATP-dependent helicase HrpB|uniref:ATP-dependent helicase HrpB n=1 Tax=Dokdonella fugitiva TaxID=328517 RepID=A0A4R2IGC2_9GAMM|nr:ATP-dependent helicase HrpB [Dokdonella fugitiva]MBA8882758.1 ATP-dependent helicase HrpB [Dokdonella fugitiva]TCO43266.1 ATP-dependent helicase HrpB [Dokdonella fugitiva]